MCVCVCVCVCFLLDFDGVMWDLISFVPDHCVSFFSHIKVLNSKKLLAARNTPKKRKQQSRFD